MLVLYVPAYILLYVFLIISKVATVLISSRLLPGSFASGKSLPLEMLRAGWATTYEQSGAEYGKWGKVEFLRIESEAKYAQTCPPMHLISGFAPFNLMTSLIEQRAVVCGRMVQMARPRPNISAGMLSPQMVPKRQGQAKPPKRSMDGTCGPC